MVQLRPRATGRTYVAAAGMAAVLCLSTIVGFGGLSAAGAAQAVRSVSHNGRVVLAGTEASSAARRDPAGAVSKSSLVNFDLVLQLRNASGAQQLVKEVSSPDSSSFRKYVTAAEWESRYSPSANEVSAAKAWLRSEGFKVGAVSKDRITIAASGTAAQVEKAFGTGLENYKLEGRTIRLTTSALSVPSSVAADVVGALGINQTFASPADSSGVSAAGSSAKTPTATSSKYAPPPPAFVTAPPCGTYYGQKTTTLSPPYGHGYPKTVPDEVCGYKPGQFRSAYGISSATTGKGVTVAIIDAYSSATIAGDATTYFKNNDPGNPFSNAHFTADDSFPFDQETLCDSSSWMDEQAIDVEAVHSMAPDAHILFVGAQDCLDQSLFGAEQDVIDNGLANVVSNSWGDTGGDLFDDVATRTSYDDLFMLADSTGITVQFSTGDYGDNFSVLGLSSADYPAESPYVTAVGGTSLQVGKNGQQIGQLGWSTGRSWECTSNVVGVLPGCTSKAVDTWLPVSFDAGSGGFTSYNYTQPWYQASVVPSTLALRNEAVDGDLAMRVIPDISLDADPSTGFLIGLHEIFANGKDAYGQTRYGGTSLASPLLAGVIADADQASIAAGGAAVGFINPAIYRLDPTKGAIDDIVSGGLQAEYRVDHGYSLATGLKGVVNSFRELTYTGVVTYCDETGNCESRPNTLTVAKGYDSLTGLGSIGPEFVKDLSSF
jgi:subtilase family serine protease